MSVYRGSKLFWIGTSKSEVTTQERDGTAKSDPVQTVHGGKPVKSTRRLDYEPDTNDLKEAGGATTI